jgi:hypothetical protein
MKIAIEAKNFSCRFEPRRDRSQPLRSMPPYSRANTEFQPSSTGAGCMNPNELLVFEPSTSWLPLMEVT